LCHTNHVVFDQPHLNEQSPAAATAGPAFGALIVALEIDAELNTQTAAHQIERFNTNTHACLDPQIGAFLAA